MNISERGGSLMKLTVLTDNNTFIDRYFWGEPALSFLLEGDGLRVLFDTGYSDAFLRNAEKMGVDLKALTHIVLSHGHDDHTRGLQYLPASGATLLCHPGCFEKKYDGDLYVGAPFSVEEAAKRWKLCPSSEPVWLSSALVFLGQIPRVTAFENRVPVGQAERAAGRVADFLPDDSALALRTDKGIFVITGCSHSGICNIIEQAKAVCGDRRVAGVIGGFHLFEEDEQLEKTIDYFRSCKVEKLYPCHCVSLKAKHRMMTHLPVTEVGVGMVLELS